MDQHREYQHSSWSYDNTVPPLPYHDGGGSSFNHGHGTGFSHYDHHRRYQNHYQDGANEATDSFGYATPSNAFAGRKRQFSHHGPSECMDGVSYAKLYVRGVPREVTEQDIHSLFGKHGSIIEVVLFKEIKDLQGQECCFVKYAKNEDAAQAIKALHNQYTFPGGIHPIEVRHASKKQERSGYLRTHECKVFVSFLNKHASKLEIAQIFSPYGYVEDVFLLRDEQKQNRGMGFISFSHKDMAVAAVNALNGKYVMNGCDQPLVVRLAGPKKPKTGENRSAPYVSDHMGQSSQPNNSSHMSSQTGCEPPSVSSTCSVPTSEMADLSDCNWSEHICPDGNTYYYNCVTCESHWEKPQEYRFYEQQIESCQWQQHIQ